MSNALISHRSNSTTVTVHELELENRIRELAPDAVIVVNGQQLTADDVLDVLETHRAAGLEIEQLRNQLAMLVAAQRARRARVRLVVDTLKSYVGGRFGLKSTQYAAFGFAPKPRKQPTVETMQAAVQKQLATRKLRHTMGKRQRLAIKAAAPAPAPEASGIRPPTPTPTPTPTPIPTPIPTPTPTPIPTPTPTPIPTPSTR